MRLPAISKFLAHLLGEKEEYSKIRGVRETGNAHKNATLLAFEDAPWGGRGTARVIYFRELVSRAQFCVQTVCVHHRLLCLHLV